MECVDGFTKVISIHVGIDFGGGDGFVAQKVLDYFEVGTTFYEVGGEGVAESVRADGFLDAGSFDEFLNNHKNHDAAESGATPVEEKDIFGRFGDVHMVADVLDVYPDVLDGIIADRDDSLFVPFSNDADETNVKKNVGQPEGSELGDT